MRQICSWAAKIPWSRCWSCLEGKILYLTYFETVSIVFVNGLDSFSDCAQDLRNRWDRQSRAFYNLFRQADRVERLAEIIQRLVEANVSCKSFMVSLYINLAIISICLYCTSVGARWSEASRKSFGVWKGFPAGCSCAKDNWKCEYMFH